MATIDIGNYRYNTDGSVKVIDITLDYDPEEPIKSTFEIDGVSYQVTNMSGCFYACSNLTVAPNIPETVTDMSGCFYGCSSLTQAPVIPSGVTDLSTCFYNCSSLTTSPVIPNTVTDMSGCFYGCYNLTTSPVIPNSVISINSCFYRCYSLQTPPTIPNNITDMAYCFASCTGLTTAPEIPEGITDLTFCFYSCSSLTQAPEIPNGVTNLYGCFYDCTSLTTFSDIPASVTNMDYCFYNCISLDGTMNVYNTPTTYENIFTGVNSLTIITIGTTNAIYNTWNTIVSDYEHVVLLDYISDESFIIFYFDDYTYQAVVSGTKIINNYGQTIYNANTNTEADSYATVELKYEAVANSTITVYYQGSGMGITHDVSFIAGTGTTQTQGSITYDGNATFTLTQDGSFSWIEYDAITPTYGLSATARSKTKTSYSTLESTFYIGLQEYNLVSLENCFLNCRILKQAPSIPMGVTNIKSCFSTCIMLKQTPVIPSTVTDMSYCFNHCESLTQAPTIPSSVTNMGECFGGCRALTQAPVIPSNVTNLRSCFEGCYSLTQAPVIPSSVTDIGSCFAGCTNLTQAPDIPSSVTYAQACFQNCTALTGNIKIATTAINSGSKSFLYTTQPIYLINNTSPKDATISESLRNTAATQGNLHFEADDATSFPITPQIQRVVANESEVAGSGTYAYIRTDSDMSNISNLPVGWSIQLDSKTLQMDGSTINPTWIETSTNLTTTSKTWYNTNDLQKHTFSLNILSSIYDENQILMTTRQMNPITFILAKAPPVPFSAYHNKENKTDGVAVGILATKGELFEVDWNAQFNQDIYIIGCIAGNSLFKLDVDSSAGADTDAVSGADAELFNTIKALGWYNDVIIND